MRLAAPLGLLLGVIAAASGHAAGTKGDDPVVGRIGGTQVRLSEVDAGSGRKVAALLAQLETTARETLDRLVEERLLDRHEEPLEVAVVPDPAVDAFLSTHPEYFGSSAPPGSARDADVQRAAVRHFLEGEARKEAEQARIAQLRASARIETALPPAASLAAPLAPDRVVARVDGTAIRGAEVESRGALRLYRARGELYRERERSLERIVERRLLEGYARGQGAEPAALVSAAAGPPVDAAAIEAYRQEEARAGRPVPQASRVRPYLEFRRSQQARERVLARAREEIPVEILLRPPEPPVLPVHDADAPTLGGAPGAPRLVVYANYRCVQCRLAHEQIDRLLEAASPPRVVLRDFVPGYDPAARAASTWLRCAAEQGRHAALRHLLLEGEPPDFAGDWLGGATPEDVAARIGAEPGPFARCLEAPRTAAAIDADTAEALRLGFVGPPAFVAEGRGLSGVQSAETLKAALEEDAAHRSHASRGATSPPPGTSDTPP